MPGVNCEEGHLDVYLDELAGEFIGDDRPPDAAQLSGWWRGWEVEDAYAREWASGYTGQPPGGAT